MAQLLAVGAERDRKGALGEEHSGAALRPLQRRGWTVLHDVEYPGEANIDHLLIGPGGVIAVDSKYTTERLWVTPKAIGGSHAKYIGRAKFAAQLAQRTLHEAGLGHIPVEPALIFWGPGAPQVDGGHTVIQETTVIEGTKAARWRAALEERSETLDTLTIAAVVRRFRAQ